MKSERIIPYPKHFLFWCMASHGNGISGGDRIFIEFAKRWSKISPTTVVTWKEGETMMARNGLVEKMNIRFDRFSVPQFVQKSFVLCYLYRILAALFKSLTYRVKEAENTLLYSSSEFWMDAWPCAILKLRYPGITWAATWYQTAPSPIRGFSNGNRNKSYRLNAFLLWFTQLVVKPFINLLADVVLVNNELEKTMFPGKKTIVVLGAVDTVLIDEYLTSHKKGSKYVAVFQGRFHPQKGVVELIDIWKAVVDHYPKARLAMIGDGSLMPQVKKKIQEYKLDNNIDLLGYLFDGDKKYEIFAQSQTAVHPAFFDSGGMATAEAMAFGIPAVGFDLPAYTTYYPVGMVKVPVGDVNAFAKVVTGLVADPRCRKALGKQAREFIHASYSWDYRSAQILRQIAEMTDWGNKRVISH